MQMLKSTLQNPNFVLLFLLFWCGGASYAMRGRMHISNIWELDTFSALEGFEATHYMLLLCKQNIIQYSWWSDLQGPWLGIVWSSFSKEEVKQNLRQQPRLSAEGFAIPIL